MKNIVDDTCKVLEAGGSILYPTDTIWGLGCDACNENAIARIYDIKHRDKGKSMLILVDSMEMMKKYTKSIPETIGRPSTPITARQKSSFTILIPIEPSSATRFLGRFFASG